MRRRAQIILLAALLSVGARAGGAQDLTALEQRTEALRTQLRAIAEQEAAAQARMQQLDEELKPENVQNRAALTGPLDAEAAREQVRKQLEGEKTRLQQQLDLLATSHARLETAIAEAEAEAVRRRAAALAPTQTPTTESNRPLTVTTAATGSTPTRTTAHRTSRRHARRTHARKKPIH